MSVIYRAIIEGDLPKALGIARQRFHVIKNQPGELHMMVRILQDLDEREEMLSVCELLKPSPMHRFFAGFQLAAAAAETGQPVEPAMADLNPAERVEAAALLADKTWRNQAIPESRHIAICGTAFCGSTLLEVVLNGLDGVRTVGESHWLVKARIDQKAAPYDFADPLGAQVPQCRSCGAGCAVLTPRFRSELAAEPKGWYAKIAARLSTDVLVSADKNLPKLVVADPRMRFDALILFKSPAQAWSSERSRRPEATQGFEAMTDYMEMWRRSYAEMLDGFRPMGPKVFVSFDAFAAAPEAGLAGLTRALGLASRGGGAAAGPPGHSIEGNPAMMQRLRTSNFALTVKPLGPPAIPGDHAAWIGANAEIGALYNELCRRADTGQQTN